MYPSDFCGRTHVALGVYAVVELEVGDGTARRAALEHVACSELAHRASYSRRRQGPVMPIRMARRVSGRQAGLQARSCPKSLNTLEFPVLGPHAAITERPQDEAVPRRDGHRGKSGPTVLDRSHVGAAVHLMMTDTSPGQKCSARVSASARISAFTSTNCVLPSA